ncbi:MAG: sigma-70 family RNA polymerase sigma factor [Bacteroidetes bacterium]|nr:sigma-70 family RNA polymerase sigma factor [Bacteroidota bacterium]
MSQESLDQNNTDDQEELQGPIRNKLSKPEKDKLFQEAFLPLMDSLYNFGYYLANDEDTAKDLLQETFMKAYRFIEYFQIGTNAKAWLIRIMKNTFINEYRKKSKAPHKVDIDDINQKEDIDDSHVVLDMRSEVYNSLMGDEITRAVNALPVDYRLIILLCDIEGFKYDEIAKIIDVPIGTVRSRLHRARNMLKEKLKEYARSKGFSID